MKMTSIGVSYSRKFNLGDYESVEASCSMYATPDEDEDPSLVAQFLSELCKAEVKRSVLPVLEDNEMQQYIREKNKQRQN